MIGARLAKLERRRDALVIEVAADRRRFVEATAGLAAPLGWAARVIAVARYARAHPATGGAIALVAGLVVRRALRGRMTRAAVVAAVLRHLLRRR